MPHTSVVTFTTTGIASVGLEYDIDGKIIIKTAQDSYSFSPVIRSFAKSITAKSLETAKSIFIQKSVHPVFASKQQTYGIQEFQDNVIERLQMLPINRPEITNVTDLTTQLTQDYHKFLNAYLKYFREPVFLVHADVFRVHVLTAVPQTLGLKTVWQIKQVIVNFKDLTAFTRRIQGTIEPFIAANIPKNNLYNLIFNFLNLKTVRTSSAKLQDIMRAVFMELFIEAAQALNLFDISAGTFILTGEYPLLVSNFGQTLLSILDGFVLKGLWGVYIDTEFLIPSLFTLWQQQGIVHSEMFLPFVGVVYIPLTQEPASVKLRTHKKQYVGVPHDIIRFNVKKQTDIIFSSDVQIMYPEDILVNTIIIDQRARPVEYGPTPRNNFVKINKAINKLNKIVS